MKDTLLCTTLIVCGLASAAGDNPQDAQEAPEINIVKIIDFTGTRDKAEMAQNLPEKDIQQYLQDSTRYEASGEFEKAMANSRTLKRAYSYVVRGQRYQTLADSKGFEQEGIASWYGPGFHGRKTANGETYDMNDMTAAHKELPLGTTIEVTNNANGKKVVLRVNDRGPFHGNRVLDLSRAAAEKLGVLNDGTADVHIRALR